MLSLLSFIKSITVEPTLFIDGACTQAMLVFIENVQMNKICSVSLGLSSEVCQNLSNHTEENVLVQKEFSTFTFYNSIITSVISLIFLISMGAWSDKYGRKIPLMITLICRILYASGYWLNSWQTSWPVEAIFVATFFEASGGGYAGFLPTSIAYISDVSPKDSRTTRISTANSLWFFGGPIGALTGALIIKHFSYDLALAVVTAAYVFGLMYVILFIKESHGPFMKKEPLEEGSKESTGKEEPAERVSIPRMIKDYFDWRRFTETFKTVFRKRETNTRGLIIAILVCNMMRRIARGFFMYMFTRQVLQWDAVDYSYWASFRSLSAALGSLFIVPLLTKLISLQDIPFVIIGFVSLTGEYICYALIRGGGESFLMWLGPVIGITSNVCIIVVKSLATKLVHNNEKARIMSVMAALNGFMPMIAYAAFSPIYYNTVDSFPAAQFFFSISLNVVAMLVFCILQATFGTKLRQEECPESKEIESKNSKGMQFEEQTSSSSSSKPKQENWTTPSYQGYTNQALSVEDSKA